MLESGLDALLPVDQVDRPVDVLAQPHALVEHDLEVEPVLPELGDQHVLDDVGQPVLLEEDRVDARARLGPALPAHDVVDPVVEDRHRVLEGGG